MTTSHNPDHIPAIPTQYAGYHFRSRLEARWAVFFDTLGIQWVYEDQGYELPSGPYLPDFWIPLPGAEHASDCLIEIKPMIPNEREFRLCGELREASGSYVAMLLGPPIRGAGLLWWSGTERKPIYRPYSRTRPNGNRALCSHPFDKAQFLPGLGELTFERIEDAEKAARSHRFNERQNCARSDPPDPNHQTKEQRHFWRSFYGSFPDLDSHKALVETVLCEDWPELSQIEVNRAMPELARRVRTRLGRVTSTRRQGDSA